MRDFLPELVAAPLLPLLILQGRAARKRIPRLPEAAGEAHGIAGAEDGRPPFRLLAIGESPVAGVGVQTHAQAITCCLANALADWLGRPVAWRACGRNGATVREAHAALLPDVPAQPVDLAMVAFGVNDTTAFRSPRAWRADMTALLDALEERCSPGLTILAGVPPMAHFPSLPQPLRGVLGLKSATLDRVLRELAARRRGTLHVPLALDPGMPELMAEDGYHPSAAGCAAWAAHVLRACHAHLCPQALAPLAGS